MRKIKALIIVLIFGSCEDRLDPTSWKAYNELDSAMEWYYADVIQPGYHLLLKWVDDRGRLPDDKALSDDITQSLNELNQLQELLDQSEHMYLVEETDSYVLTGINDSISEIAVDQTHIWLKSNNLASLSFDGKLTDWLLFRLHFTQTAHEMLLGKISKALHSLYPREIIYQKDTAVLISNFYSPFERISIDNQTVQLDSTGIFQVNRQKRAAIEWKFDLPDIAIEKDMVYWLPALN